MFRQILFKFFHLDSECFAKYDAFCSHVFDVRAEGLRLIVFFLVFSCIFILLSRESDQCAVRARLGVAGHLSTTPR